MIDPMAGKSRGLLIGLVLFLVVAVAGLVASIRYQQYAALHASDNASMRLASTVSLRDLMGSGGAQSQLVSVAVRKLEDDYYKPVDPSTLVSGERAELLKFLSDRHVAHATL